jgi:hypothetical protein
MAEGHRPAVDRVGLVRASFSFAIHDSFTSGSAGLIMLTLSTVPCAVTQTLNRPQTTMPARLSAGGSDGL